MLNVPCFLWWLYVSLAPVYWLPFVPQSQFDLLKPGLIASATITTLVYAVTNSRIKYAHGLLGFTGFILLLLAFIPGVLQADGSFGQKMLLNLGYALATFLCFMILAQSKQQLVEFFSYTSLVIGALAIYSVLAGIGVVSDVTSPAKFDHTPVSVSGFTGLRTGWSNGIALYIPFAAYLIVWHKWKLIKAVSCIALVGIFLSQLTVAGRNGMLATLLGGIGMLFIFGNRIVIVSVLSIGLLAVSTYLPSLTEHLRLDRIEGSTDMRSLNDFSAGRIGSYLYAVEQISNAPLTGAGFGNTDIGGHSIHNMLLRFTAETGLAFLFVFLIIIYKAVIICFKRRQKAAFAILGIIVVQGFMEAQFEPNMLLGAFQNSTLWWAALGMIAGASLVQPSLLRDTKEHKKAYAKHPVK